jgi:hypothetical protein
MVPRASATDAVVHANNARDRASRADSSTYTTLCADPSSQPVHVGSGMRRGDEPTCPRGQHHAWRRRADPSTWTDASVDVASRPVHVNKRTGPAAQVQPSDKAGRHTSEIGEPTSETLAAVPQTDSPVPSDERTCEATRTGPSDRCARPSVQTSTIATDATDATRHVLPLVCDARRKIRHRSTQKIPQRADLPPH